MLKKAIFIGLFWVFGAQIAFPQDPDSSVEKKLEAIDAYMYRDPITAKYTLLQLLKENQNSPDFSKAAISLKLATTLGMTNNLDSAFFYAIQSKELFPDTSSGKAGALKLIAILNRIKGDYKNAEIAIQESIRLNDSLWHDPHLMAVTLQEYGGLCLDQHFNFKATTLFLKALGIISKPEVLEDGGKYTAVKIRVNLAEAYLASGNYRFAIREFSKALRELPAYKDDEGLLRGGIRMAEAFILSGSYNSADSLLDRLTPIAQKLQNEELRSYIMMKQGESWSARSQYIKAIPFYRSAFDQLNASNSPALLECVNLYLFSLSKTNNSEEAHRIMSMPNVKEAVKSELPAERLEYKKLAIRFLAKELSAAQMHTYYEELLMLADSVTNLKESQSASEIQAKYQFERQQENERMLTRENELLRQKAALKLNQQYALSAIALLVIVILGMAIHRLRQRALLHSSQLISKEQEISFHKDRTDWMQREKSLRDQLINQQRVVLTQAIADKEELNHKLKELVKEKQEERRKELLEQLEKNKGKKLNIEILLIEFNSIHPNFTPKLLKKHPELSQADVQFCTLFRMNLTTKEISVLFNIDPKSIYKKKYRIMEKMGLSEVSEFEKFVFSI